MEITLKRPWFNLVMAPLWFLVLVLIFSAFYLNRGVAEDQVPVLVSEQASLILFLAQLLMLLSLIRSSRKDRFNIFSRGWTLYSSLSNELIRGLLTGAALAGLYLCLLVPLQQYLQTTLGDYVPAGETMRALSKGSLFFFMANVILAPFVEESLYRNYTLTRFAERYSKSMALSLNVVFFALLHWTGGLWYMCICGLFVGLPFALITMHRKSLVLVYIAHLSLNTIEFIYVLKQYSPQHA
ncbi:MAG TPA: CPBP family intramembrane metalloprotease [Bacteroidia bacterium]|nr:CPBP family intramembrane metalloprotease [Bacteroidia bacterium]